MASGNYIGDVINNSEFETSAKNVRFKSDSFSGGSLAARGAALMSDNKVNSVSPGAGQAVTNTSAPADTLKRPPYTRYIKVVPVGSLKRKIFSRTIPAAAGDLNLSVNRRDSMPDNDKPEKTALYNRKLEASSSEADRLYPGEHAHHWIIDSAGRGTCKYCHASKQFPEPDGRQIFLYPARYGGQHRQEYYRGGILA